MTADSAALHLVQAARAVPGGNAGNADGGIGGDGTGGNGGQAQGGTGGRRW